MLAGPMGQDPGLSAQPEKFTQDQTFCVCPSLDKTKP